jgi:hypothetical protein
VTELQHPPDVVLAGVARAGTTSLYHYFSLHPQLVVSPIKEVNFLSYPGAAAAADRTPWLHFPVTTAAQYDRLFVRQPGSLAVDFSASCFHSPVAIERIRRYVPEARLAVLLRDPVQRAWSAHLNRVRKGYERRTPDAALVPGERAVDNGFYAPGLQRLFDAFGRDKVTVWLQDDLREDTARALAAMFRDLDVRDDVEIDASAVLNAASVPRSGLLQRVTPSYRTRRRLAARLPPSATRRLRQLWSLGQEPPPVLPPEISARLQALYADDVHEVARLIGRDLSAWTPAHPIPESVPHD